MKEKWKEKWKDAATVLAVVAAVVGFASFVLAAACAILWIRSIAVPEGVAAAALVLVWFASLSAMLAAALWPRRRAGGGSP